MYNIFYWQKECLKGTSLTMNYSPPMAAVTPQKFAFLMIYVFMELQ